MTVEELKDHWGKGVEIWEQAEKDENLKPVTRKMATDRKVQLLTCIQELDLLT
jgi:hypothetical protein